MTNENSSCCSSGKKHWMWLLLIGLVLGALALYVTFRPIQGYVGLSIIFGWTFIVTGLSKIFISFSRRKVISGWGWYLVYGILSLVLGIYLVTNLALTMETLPIIFAFWLLLQGSFLISNSITMKPSKGWGWLLMGGIIAVVVSFFLLFNPILSFLTIIIWTGIGLYVASLSYILMAFGVKKMR